MRMTDRVRRDDRGAVLILVAVFSIVAVIFLAFVIDIGDQRQNRRQLTTASDAAALDVAQEWANASLSTAVLDGLVPGESSIYSCDSLAMATVTANNDGVAPDAIECFAEDRGRYGVVTVSLDEAVDYQFGELVDVQSGDTGSTTSVKITARGGGGLRPIALCGVQEDIAAWIAAGATGEPVFDITQPRFLTAACGNASGNWGLLDLAGNGSNSVGQVLTDGYDGEVTISPTPDACDDKAPEVDDGDGINCINTSPGNKWNSSHVRTALDFLDGPDGCAEGGIDFSLPVYTDVQGGGGNTADFPITGFAQVQLMCHTIGNGSTGPTNLTLRMLGYDDQGPCCGVTATNRILEICDVGTAQGNRGATFGTACSDSQPTPPVVGDSCAATVTASDPTPAVTGNNLDGPLTVTVTLTAHDDCGTITLRAVSGADEISPNSSTGSGATRTFQFNAGAPFGAVGTERVLDVREDGITLNDAVSVLTDSVVAPPECALSASLADATITTTSNGGGNQVRTDENVVVNITIPTPANCGDISVVAALSNLETFNSTGPAASSMTFTLPSPRSLPNRTRHGVDFNVTVRDDGDPKVVLTFTTFHPSGS